MSNRRRRKSHICVQVIMMIVNWFSITLCTMPPYSIKSKIIGLRSRCIPPCRFISSLVSCTPVLLTFPSVCLL
ncbi:hypothetical protein GGR53DRAFT_44701 [Hypoxylon sp. FL1150]|nr:hypothetical protein GGR53DRAFT_44701 [Hypoxylon sp. FL1150]